MLDPLTPSQMLWQRKLLPLVAIFFFLPQTLVSLLVDLCSILVSEIAEIESSL